MLVYFKGPLQAKQLIRQFCFLSVDLLEANMSTIKVLVVLIIYSKLSLAQQVVETGSDCSHVNPCEIRGRLRYLTWLLELVKNNFHETAYARLKWSNSTHVQRFNLQRCKSSAKTRVKFFNSIFCCICFIQYFASRKYEVLFPAHATLRV